MYSLVQAVPRAEQLTREQLQPAAEDAAKQLDEGAQKLTQEVIQPAAQVNFKLVVAAIVWQSELRRRFCITFCMAFAPHKLWIALADQLLLQ